MEPEMQFLQAPKDHLDTWRGVNRLILWSTIGIVVVLLLMAATLL